QKAGFPRFKGKYRYSSFTYPGTGWELMGDKLKLSKIGTMRVMFTRPIEGTIKTVQIKREVDFFYVIFTCEIKNNQQVNQDKLLKIKAGNCSALKTSMHIENFILFLANGIFQPKNGIHQPFFSV
ncbi:MAG TPA: hypothetical protein PK683_21710, partial [Leptospiraceae bacterium]|nr:hypothetical protein [Leptospiraceae bacterium]